MYVFFSEINLKIENLHKLQQWEECSHPLRPVTRPGFRRKKGKVATGPRFPYKPNTPAKNPSAQCFGNWHSSWSIHMVGRSVKSLCLFQKPPTLAYRCDGLKSNDHSKAKEVKQLLPPEKQMLWGQSSSLVPAMQL